MVGIAASEKTDLFDLRQGIEAFDESVRAGIEALILHTWYCDLWDVRSDDPENWDVNIFRNIMAVVTKDRKITSPDESGEDEDEDSNTDFEDHTPGIVVSRVSRQGFLLTCFLGRFGEI